MKFGQTFRELVNGSWIRAPRVADNNSDILVTCPDLSYPQRQTTSGWAVGYPKRHELREDNEEAGSWPTRPVLH